MRCAASATRLRILASLEHPWIARFLDGGLSAEGIWFLALEYVEGDDLTTHASRQELDARSARAAPARGRSMRSAYAHGRGVVHRDLKPGERPGRPRRPAAPARLRHLEAARPLGPGDDAIETAQGFRPLTPAYASPEQFAGRAVDAGQRRLLPRRHPLRIARGAPAADRPERRVQRSEAGAAEHRRTPAFGADRRPGVPGAIRSAARSAAACPAARAGPRCDLPARAAARSRATLRRRRRARGGPPALPG